MCEECQALQNLVAKVDGYHQRADHAMSRAETEADDAYRDLERARVELEKHRESCPDPFDNDWEQHQEDTMSGKQTRGRGELQQAVLDVMVDGAVWRSAEIGERLDLPVSGVSVVTGVMVKNGKLEKMAWGQFRIAAAQEPSEDSQQETKDGAATLPGYVPQKPLQQREPAGQVTVQRSAARELAPELSDDVVEAVASAIRQLDASVLLAGRMPHLPEWQDGWAESVKTAWLAAWGQGAVASQRSGGVA